MDKNLQLFKSAYPAKGDINQVSFEDGCFVAIRSTKEASFAVTRVNAAWWAFQHQQEKVEELEKEWLEMNQQHEQAVKECYEVNAENRKLQKRMDKAIEALKSKIEKVQKYEQDSFDHGAVIGLDSALRTVEQALKGEYPLNETVDIVVGGASLSFGLIPKEGDQ